MSLHHERLLDEGIKVHLNTSNVSDEFKNAASRGADSKSNRPVVDSQEYLHNQNKCEKGSHEGVSRERWIVQVLGLRNGTGV